MKRLAVGLVQRVLVSVTVVMMIGGLGITYGHFFGPSKIAYSVSIILIALPWTFPQIFLMVCLIWFIFQHVRIKGSSPAL